MDIHVGKLVAEQVDLKRFTKAKFARFMNVNQPSASRMMTTKSMQTDRLVELSQKLDYNFFKVIGKRLGIASPALFSPVNKDEQIKTLMQENERLKEENRYLKKAIDLFGSKGN
jgi:hypothetical protein